MGCAKTDLQTHPKNERKIIMSTPRVGFEIAKVATSLEELRRQPAPTEQK